MCATHLGSIVVYEMRLVNDSNWYWQHYDNTRVRSYLVDGDEDKQNIPLHLWSSRSKVWISSLPTSIDMSYRINGRALIATYNFLRMSLYLMTDSVTFLNCSSIPTWPSYLSSLAAMRRAWPLDGKRRTCSVGVFIGRVLDQNHREKSDLQWRTKVGDTQELRKIRRNWPISSMCLGFYRDCHR